jgi:5-methylcytosine-specific restriction protein A
VLADEPLCRFCAEQGRVTAARDVDHIVPIVQRPDLRLDRSNLRPLCQPCHASLTARGEQFRGRSDHP